MRLNISVDQSRIAAFCRKWKIRELSLFGSVLREDFQPDSDVDVLVSLAPDAPWTLWDWIDMKDELGDVFCRKVDLVDKDSIRNPYRRHRILSSKQVVFAD